MKYKVRIELEIETDNIEYDDNRDSYTDDDKARLYTQYALEHCTMIEDMDILEVCAVGLTENQSQ